MHYLPGSKSQRCFYRKILHMSHLPEAPWAEDFAGPFPNGDDLLVAVYDYSRYPEVEIVGTTCAKSTIPRLDAIFAYS